MQRNLFLAAGSLALLLSSAFAAHAQTDIVYANEDNFTGYGITAGGATTANKYTGMIADDITVASGYGGLGVVSLDFSIANLNAATVSVAPTLNFYDINGADGGPGTLLGTVTFNSISVASGVGLYTYVPTSGFAFTIPTSGSFWAGETFSSTTATVAQLNNIGQGTFDPPTVGTSQDLIFETDDAGKFNASNPVGAQYAEPFEPTVVGNLGWEFEVATPASVPEASTTLSLGLLLALGLGAACIKSRKKVIG